MITPQDTIQIQVWPIDRLVFYACNPKLAAPVDATDILFGFGVTLGPSVGIAFAAADSLQSLQPVPNRI
jgi:hypothetical protein